MDAAAPWAGWRPQQPQGEGAGQEGGGGCGQQQPAGRGAEPLAKHRRGAAAARRTAGAAQSAAAPGTFHFSGGYAVFRIRDPVPPPPEPSIFQLATGSKFFCLLPYSLKVHLHYIIFKK